METEIREHLQHILNILIKNKKIIFPDKKFSNDWKNILRAWADDNSMTLFLRRSGEIRGKMVKVGERMITTTDNTPAHWIFKNIVLDKKSYSFQEIKTLIHSNKFPIGFIRKKSEIETLLNEMVADKQTRLNIASWKLAHINRIAMKRGKTISIDDYKKHHISFLDLSNMYLIDKEFSGLAEVKLFNDLVTEYIGEE